MNIPQTLMSDRFDDVSHSFFITYLLIEYILWVFMNPIMLQQRNAALVRNHSNPLHRGASLSMQGSELNARSVVEHHALEDSRSQRGRLHNLISEHGFDEIRSPMGPARSDILLPSSMNINNECHTPHISGQMQCVDNVCFIHSRST